MREGDSYSERLCTTVRLAAYSLTRLRVLVRLRPQCAH
jgi:hypothetical protein